jgi:broad specificity phosphatase PhoE
MRTVWLVRHAEAGARGGWAGGPDRERPLSDEGRRQAARLLDILRARGADRAQRVLSSPYPRCRQTVEPLAGELGLPVEDDEALQEGAAFDATLALLLSVGDAIACTHGDVMGNVVEHLLGRGIVSSRDAVWEKGCTWVLGLDGGEVVSTEHVPPPR